MHEIIAKSILSNKNKNGMNIYRGCSHGCIYCDTRSTCYHNDHEFTDVGVKVNTLELLEKELKSKRNKCMIGTGSMCDPYLHIEKDLMLTRKCLELLNRYEFGATVITKSDLVLRDLDLFNSINKNTKAVLQMTLTTYDDNLCKIIEPNVASTSRRAEVLNIFRDNNIPTIVWLCPILPYINDTEENIRGILDICIKAKVKGIVNFGMGLTLREGSREYFYKKLDESFPGLKDRYIKEFGYSYEIHSNNGKKLYEIFKNTCIDHGIMYKPNDVFGYLNEFPNKYEQISMF